jgi:serine/threonine protein kinase/formylglycine-generating enzyme required for sulfatase activity
MACPNENTILAFVQGELTPFELGGIEEHASGCPTCERLLSAGLAAGSRAEDFIASSLPAPKSRPLGLFDPGAPIGRYTVLSLVGQGGMGNVYGAYDPQLDRKIALKLLRPRFGEGDLALDQERLVREAKAIAKLSHPNIVAIFDVGVHEGNVFLAMEYLGGGTLNQWVTAEKRPWREVVKMFIEVGRGLAAAHAEGLIHRDFKPDNVLIDKNGVAKVVDFGLVRMADSVDPSAMGATDLARSDEFEPPKSGARAGLTRTGALLGTPAYMAPEQFLAGTTDARTDQFAFCASLYEALFNQRPFAGDSLPALRDAVTGGRMLAAPEGSAVPGWIRRVLRRGLALEPAQRYPNMSDLLQALAADPIARRHRRLLAAVTLMAVAGGVLATRHLVPSKRHEIDKQAAGHVQLADSFHAEADAKRKESNMLRVRAFAAFDSFDRDSGETLWAQALAAAKAADAGYQRGVQRLEAAVALTPRRELKERIADALVAYLQMEGRSTSEREAGLRQLAPYDEGGARARRLAAPATMRVETTPAGIPARLEMYDPVTHLPAEPPRQIGRTPLELSLVAGSYRLTFAESATHVGFHYPILVASGEKLSAVIPVPSRSAVPKDFIYVPEGRFLFGSGNEDLRTAFLETVPLHTIDSSAFLVSRYETTIGEWIAFLDTLPAARREMRRPQGRKDGKGGFIDVQRRPDGGWEIVFRATDRTYQAGANQRFRYQDRTRRESQDWTRFPVTGVSPEDAIDFAGWLDRSRRVPGARLCTEREWERAARGADAREFPHGNRLLRDDANFDLTYGRKNGAYGPDEVGSHPISASPFGVHDLAGNVWDITSSVLDEGQFVARGGSFYQNLRTILSTNRDPLSAVTRDHTVGLRICADAPL